MRIKSFAFIILGSLVATSSFAAGFLQKLIPSQKNHGVQEKMIHQSKSGQPVTATDFSGNWGGSCDGFISELNTTIENTDDSITLDGEYFDINTMITEASANAKEYSNGQLRFSWNSTKTVLTLHGAGVATFTKNDEFVTYLAEISYALNNNQLTLTGTSRFYDKLELIDSFPINCVLNKQAD